MFVKFNYIYGFNERKYTMSISLKQYVLCDKLIIINVILNQFFFRYSVLIILSTYSVVCTLEYAESPLANIELLHEKKKNIN